MARDFDGVDDEIDINADVDFANLEPISIASWIKPDTFGEGGFGRIVTKQATGAFRWQFNIKSSTDNLVWERNFSTTTGEWTTPNDSITLDVWIHVIVVYNSNSTTNDPVMYIDGVSQTITEGQTPVGSATDDSGVNIRIGNNEQLNRTFNGSICEVAVWNAALSAAEALALSHTINPLHIRRTNLKVYLPILGHSSPEADLSGNKNNGVVTGAVKSSHAAITPYQMPIH